MKKTGLLFGLIVFLGLSLTMDANARKTRDLVFEDDEQPAAAKSQTDLPRAVVAVKTAIELERDGQTTTVLPTHEFINGDKVKFIYTTNVDAYVYWLSQGTSGEYYMLFPNPKVGTDNFVKKNEIQTIPVKGSFKFSGKTGVEKILLVMSPERIPDLEKASKEAAIKGGRVKDEADRITKVNKRAKSKRKTRDLVFEEEEDEKTGVATHSQSSKDISDPMVVYYELIHK